jgi:hypothetical protein
MNLVHLPDTLPTTRNTFPRTHWKREAIERAINRSCTEALREARELLNLLEDLGIVYL